MRPGSDPSPTGPVAATRAGWPVAIAVPGLAGVVALGLRAPVAAGVLAVVVFVVTAVVTRRTIVRGVLVAIAAVLGVSLAAEGLLRAGEAASPKERFEGSYATSAYWNRQHPLLGYAPVPGAAVRSMKYVGDTLAYDVEYTIGADGLRRSAPADAASPAGTDPICVLFFGDSITFGEGVPDEAAMPYRVGQLAGPGYRIYNFGFHGYGPHHMLAALERGVVRRVVDCPGRTIAVLQYDLGHVVRMRGSPWDPHGPRYLPGDDGFMHAAGRFDEPAPPSAPEAPARPWREVRIVQRIQSLFDLPYYDADDVRWFRAAMLTAKRELEALFPDVRVHLILRDPWRDDDVVPFLEERGISVYPIRDILPDFSLTNSKYNLGLDPHPNALQHDAIARYVVAHALAER